MKNNQVHKMILKVINFIEIESKLYKKNEEDLPKKRLLKDILFDLHEIRRTIENSKKHK